MLNSIRCHAGTLAAVAVLCAGAVGCAHAPPAPPATDDPEPFVLTPGDMVRLKVWRGEDMTGDYLVNNDGVVVFPLIGPMTVTGMSADSLKTTLVNAYSRYVRTPSIEVLPLRRINIYGAVQNGGLYPVDPTMTVADALALAGGVTPQGDPNKVDLIRDGRRIRAELTEDTRIMELPIRSGDHLYVPERSWISRNIGLVSTVVSGFISVAIVLLNDYLDKDR
ncbi:MAG TPA: polysaccharide biosynthesis/export family protein [Longimicrobiales bacterium]